MAARYSPDEKIETNAFVYIEGDKVDYESLVLEQSFSEHHTFTVVMDYDRMKHDFMRNPLEHMKLIGRFLDIEIQQGKDNANAYVFRGIIQDVSHQGSEGKHGYLILSGNSPTIQLERGQRYDIFCDMTLQRVFEEVTAEIVNKKDRLPCVNSPVYNGQIRFLMQYNESDWAFLRRLASITGETLYYTGMDLVFGTHKDWEATEVTYDKEIIDFRFGSRLLANNFVRYQYLPENDDTITQNAPDRIEDADEYVKSAAERGRELTEKRPVVAPLSVSVDDIGALGELVNREKTANAARTVYVQGKAKTCAPRIGRLLTIGMPSNMSGASDLGTFRITKVKHTIDQKHTYSCEFEGIPADLKFVPVGDVRMPVADSIRATVIRNDDPQGQGRVRVEFPFAQDRPSEVWLRVMTPNAGSSDVVGTNRGMVFVPEQGDQVMVGFEFGDPNQPYVMGSMFHGKNGTGGGANNAEKSIITRSGIKIVFNDEQKSLHIEDPSGNTWDMDGDGNIAVNAPKNMTITVGENMDVTVGKNISVSAGENILVDAGQNIDETAGGDINQTASGDMVETANNKTEIVEKDFQRVSENSVLQSKEITMFSSKENMLLQSGKTVEMNSAEKSNMY
ncbi:MAG: type VI secretion system Vgr family protein [Dysgonomonas sp.]